jgi:hypothetical protein
VEEENSFKIFLDSLQRRPEERLVQFDTEKRTSSDIVTIGLVPKGSAYIVGEQPSITVVKPLAHKSLQPPNVQESIYPTSADDKAPEVLLPAAGRWINPG